jgi:hypothetical protein
LKAEKARDRFLTHGKRGTATTYNVWAKMRRRCTVEADPAFRDYGGRGVYVCERWMNGEGGLTAFECFLADMLAGPGLGRWQDVGVAFVLCHGTDPARHLVPLAGQRGAFIERLKEWQREIGLSRAELRAALEYFDSVESLRNTDEELKDEEKAEVADAEQCAEKVTQAFGDSVKHAMRGEHPDAFKRRFSKDYQKNSQVYAGVNLDNVKDKTALSIAFSQICADSVSAANVMPRNNGRGAWITEQRGGRTIERVQGMSDDAAFSEFRIKPRMGNLIQRGSL